MTALEPSIPVSPTAPVMPVVPVTSLLHDDGFVALADDLQRRGGLRGRAARMTARARVGAVRTPSPAGSSRLSPISPTSR